MSKDYDPSPSEENFARKLDAHIEALLNGELDGIAFCAVNKQGDESFFYLNTPSKPVLRSPMNKLMGLYEFNTRMRHLSNAPAANRSFKAH